jgi:hypothetical protein
MGRRKGEGKGERDAVRRIGEGGREARGGEGRRGKRGREGECVPHFLKRGCASAPRSLAHAALHCASRASFRFSLLSTRCSPVRAGIRRTPSDVKQGRRGSGPTQLRPGAPIWVRCKSGEKKLSDPHALWFCIDLYIAYSWTHPTKKSQRCPSCQIPVSSIIRPSR